MLLKRVVLIALLLAALPAMGQSRRAGQSEVYLAPVFTDGKNYTFEGGTTVKTDTGFGFSFGYAYNISQQLQAGVDIAWGQQDYRANVAPGAGNPSGITAINGTIETSTVRFNGTFNFSKDNFTPFVTGGLGWTYIDTNIPSGLPDTFCWYYPWYGQYCSTSTPTHTVTKFSYNAGAGLRLDHGRSFFRLLVNSQWVDFGGNYGSSSNIQYRIDLGTRF